MGVKKKQGKDRQDKYYHLAKTQGYRARSAYKLIQLNKKYGFLEQAQVVVDLCAAPGGWLQVASKYMPVNSLIIGVDLVPIKPIPRVITHVEDITTDKCRATLKKDIKDWKVDVVLHDGAPNVGAAWLQDAFSQSELTLSSLKLAVELLKPGGVFVTKVFRSKDYNNLTWVFNQLFSKVEATKPPSSRSVSAEIFVVCRGFLAPKKLDPKFLDPRFVFRDVDDENPASIAKTSLNTILYPQKASKQRKRDGYQEGDYTLHHAFSVWQFLNLSEAKAIEVLATSHVLTWDQNEEAMEKLKRGLPIDIELTVLNHPRTKNDISEICKDLKVLGRREFKLLLKWRLAIQELLNDFEAKQKDTAADTAEDVVMEEKVEEEDLVAELDVQVAAAKLVEKKARKKKMLKVSKLRRRLLLSMDTPVDLASEVDPTVDAEKEVETFGDSLAAIHDSLGIDPADFSDDDKASGESDNGDSDFVDDETRTQQRIDELELNIDLLYEDFKRRQREKDSKCDLKQERAEEEPFLGIQSDTEKNEDASSSDDDSLSDSEALNDESEVDAENLTAQPTPPPSSKSTVSSIKEPSKVCLKWFDQPLFNDASFELQTHTNMAPLVAKKRSATATIPSRDLSSKLADAVASRSRSVQPSKDQNPSQVEMADTPMDIPEEDEDDIAAIKELKRQAKRHKPDSKKRNDDDDDGKIQLPPPATPKMAANRVKDLLSTAEAITIAMKMVQDGGNAAEDVLDDFGYGRHVHPEDPESMPMWFVDDERAHNIPNRPITKEAVQLMRARQKEVDARPIKKVLEAKARKKFKSTKQLEKLRKKMNNVYEEGGVDDPEQNSKLSQIGKIMNSALNKIKKTQRRKVNLVVAKNGNKKVAGRPGGVKGRYKMVDSRLKKDLRAEKSQKKRDGKKPKGGNSSSSRNSSSSKAGRSSAGNQRGRK